MAITELLELPPDQRAEIAVALLDSLSPDGSGLTAEQEDALIRSRDAGEFIGESEFFAPFEKTGYGKAEPQ